MNTRLFQRQDFSMGIQNGSSWMLRQRNEIDNGRNLRFNEEIGAIVRRNGYVELNQPFSASGKKPLGFHTANFTTGSRRFVAVQSENNASVVVKVQELDGSWTTIISDIPLDSDVHFCDYRDEVYVSGYVTTTDIPFAPYNIDKTLNVSKTRNLLFAPYAKYYVVYRGILYAANVVVGSDRYSDRIYKGSSPTGAITFVRGAQTNTSVPLKYVNQVPTMTGPTAPSGTASTNGLQPAGEEAYRAFDKTTTGQATFGTSSAGSFTGGLLQYSFPTGQAKTITHYRVEGYRIGVPERSPKTWTFQGSNDNSTWTTLHTVSAATGWASGETRTYTIPSPASYLHYRMNITDIQRGGTNNDVVNIVELGLLTTTQSVFPLQLNVDSVRYVKAGMDIDIYRSGQSEKLSSVVVYAVDKMNNSIQFLPENFVVSSVDIATDTFTVPSNTRLITGAPVVFDAASTPPAPLVTGVTYYVINVSNTTVKLATTYDNAIINQPIDITTAGTGYMNIRYSYILNDNDELYLSGRYGLLTTLWNTDYPAPDKADWTAVQPGTDSSISITGVKESANRLFVFTLNSANKFDGNTMMAFSKSIGCASQRSIQNIDDDWLIWLTARGRVYARNEAGGQQEYISRGAYNKFFSKLTLDQMVHSAAGITDNEYSVYVGEVDGEPSRAVYDFGSNTWSIDSLGHPTLMYANDVVDGVIKPLFASDNGKLYQDDTGNTDAEKVTRIQIDLGKTNYGSNNEKQFIGHYIHSHNAKGMKIVIRVDNNDPLVVGEINSDYGELKYKIEANSKKKYTGTTIEVSLKSAVDGPPQVIYSVDDYFNLVQEINAHAKKQ